MDRQERHELGALAREVAVWVRQARDILATREGLPQVAAAAEAALRRNVVEVPDGRGIGWRLLPLRGPDARLIGEIARATRQGSLTPGVQGVLQQLVGEVAGHVQATGAVSGLGRIPASVPSRRDRVAEAADFLRRYRDWAISVQLPGLLTRLRAVVDVSVEQVLEPAVGVVGRLSDLGARPVLVPAVELAGLPGALVMLRSSSAGLARVRAAAVAAGDAVRASAAAQVLAATPLETLAEVSRDRLRLTLLAEAGVSTVGEVLERGESLERLDGMGPASADRILAAARTVRRHVLDELPVRLDPQQRTDEATELLHRMIAWEAARRLTQAELERAGRLVPVAESLTRGASAVVVWGVRQASGVLLRDVRQALSLAAPLEPTADPWQDYRDRPAHYAALLDELGLTGVDASTAHGELPEEIVEAARERELDTSRLTATLRGYQSFAARFALVQRKVIIGDEMGLGKTLEALAVLAHLAARGERWSLVVCPAAVMTNWVREVADKSTLTPHRLHGLDLESAAARWRAEGGVGVTTYAMLRRLQRTGLPPLACVVVDEAHHIKNPDAQRSQRSRELIAGADRALLLTGTPLENRIEEFKVLVGYLRPDLVIQAGEVPARTFRRQVAPAYLRRNQEDVLTELPELVQVAEWLPMSRADETAYRLAVQEGNFAAMRQAAMLQGARSTKVERLRELVAEAEANGRRVLVFSFFREVLDQVAAALPGQVFGPLTGSVPAARRQQMVDDFSAASHGATLVAQIEAGGVGLNIQAASVVVICEPQFKPTAEWQAIARSRRMGQLESVQVHRLLSEEGVDVRISEILSRKSLMFDDFARISETAEAALDEAFDVSLLSSEVPDVSDAEAAREILALERERLALDPSA